MTCRIYRCFDKDSKLLYVGISINALSRLATHMSTALFAEEIVRVEIEVLPSREAARAAEKAAIHAEAPLYNSNAKPSYGPLIKDISAPLGGRAALARKLGINESTVWRWGKHMPMKYMSILRALDDAS